MRRLFVVAVASLALTSASPAAAATIGVKISKSGFSPVSITVNSGDSVTWTNRDSATHQIVADNGAFASPILKQGQHYTFTFNTAGTYRYHDAIKPSLHGTIVVKGPPPSLTFGATVPIIVAGAPSTVGGVVSSKKSGETVTIWAQAWGSASPVQVTTIQSVTGGLFTYTVSPDILTAYFAQWKSAKSAPVTIQVKPKITFVPQGGRFYAKVSSAGHSWANHYIYLQRLSRFGQWVTVLKLRLGALSGRLFSIPRVRGLSTYRIYMSVNEAGSGFLDSHSGTQKIRRR